MTVAQQDIEIEGRPAQSLGLGDSPRLAEAAVLAVVDGEGVVLDGATGASHLLNATAAVVAQCLDGSATLAVLCREIAEETGADEEQVGADVVALARVLAERGLLAGFRPTVAQHDHEQTPTLPLGSELHGLHAEAADGTEIDDAWLAEGESLVISWGARCGYCTRSVPELVELLPGLTAAGVRLVLLTTADRAAVAEQVGAAGAALPVYVTEELPSWLAGLGTPVGYAVGAGARSRSLLALGATPMVALGQALVAGELPEA